MLRGVWHTRGMSAVRIREAEAGDDEAVGALLVQAFVEQYARKMPEVVVSERRKDDLRRVSAKRAVAKVWVAELNGRVVGTVAVWPAGAPGSEAWIPGAFDLRHLAVDAQARGQGVSGALLDAAETFARGAGASAMCLHVRQGAVGVRRLYEQRGYRREPSGDLDARPEVFLEAFVLALR
ncbi:MAG: GNAT family N-acetyltransferase [Myxococcaceae bacterium]|nr:GNAT family N-acetyltransferase [Myxococcaceae bacterium]